MEKFSSIDKAMKGTLMNNFERNVKVTLRKYQVQLLLRLEAELQGHDERVVDTRKHEPLR